LSRLRGRWIRPLDVSKICKLADGREPREFFEILLHQTKEVKEMMPKLQLMVIRKPTKTGRHEKRRVVSQKVVSRRTIDKNLN